MVTVDIAKRRAVCGRFLSVSLMVRALGLSVFRVETVDMTLTLHSILPHCVMTTLTISASMVVICAMTTLFVMLITPSNECDREFSALWQGTVRR